jgi:hypothetical protein
MSVASWGVATVASATPVLWMPLEGVDFQCHLHRGALYILLSVDSAIMLPASLELYCVIQAKIVVVCSAP